VLGLCEDLKARGNWDVHLATARQSYAAAEGAIRGATVHNVDFRTSRFDFSLPRKLARVVADINPDLIHVHGGRAAHQFSLAPLRGKSLRIVYTVHGYHFPNKPAPLRWLARTAEKTIAKRVSHLCFVSEADRAIAIENRIVSRDGPHSIIYNGINPADFPPSPVRDNSHSLVFVGRLVRQKNPQFAIDVIDALKSDRVTLLMVGGGELEAEVRRKAADLGVEELVTFTGPLSRTDAIASLYRAKLLLFPSRWEGLPIGPMEALFCGTPVVGSNVGGTNEVVSSGQDGVLIDEFDKSEYAREIRRLLNSELLLDEYRKNGLNKVREHFLRSASTDKYVTVYQQILSRGPAR
jgi:glycosyltransferase involved in cell wall biosynthesis